MRTLLLAGLVLAPLAACQNSMMTTADSDPKTEATVYRTYGKNVEEVWKSVKDAVKELDLNIDRGNHDALGGALVAKRATKEKVEIDVKVVDPQNTQVAVHVNPGDRNMAQVIQDRIATKLGVQGREAGKVDGAVDGQAPANGAGVARTTFDAGGATTVEGVYGYGTQACAAAAEKALEALQMPVTAKDVQESSARVESQGAQIRMERKNRGETRVVFSAARGRNGDARTLADRLKTEFEKAIR